MNDTVTISLDTLQTHINEQLRAYLPSPQKNNLQRAMHYAVMNGGKRLRPLLVYATGLALDAQITNCDKPAAAVEFIHCYSLVHDDLPAMDDDDLRRGQPSCHKAFDEATAILVGDALQSLAFELIADTPAMVLTLAEASGSQGMVGGQAFDCQSEGTTLTLEQLENMHQQKTGALIRASVRLGALAAGCTDKTILQTLDQFAQHLGLAFQIQDDILDVEGTTQQLGKQVGADAQHGKATYPGLLGLDQAKEKLAALEDQIANQLSTLSSDTELLSILVTKMIRRVS